MKHYTREEIHLLVTQGYLDARQNERSKGTQLLYEIHQEANIADLTNALYNREWKPAPPIVFVVTDPTVREVFAPQFPDRIVSHIVYSLLSPLFERRFIYDSYSCRKGKGTLFGIERFEHHIRSVTDNYKYTAYILNLDISGYFMSIHKPTLYDIIHTTLDEYAARDCRPGVKWSDVIDFEFCDYVIRQILFRDPLKGSIYMGDPKLRALVPPQKLLRNSPADTGLIIGDLTSQLFSNVYLNPFDHFVKRALHIKGYGRYVDDGRMIHRDKDYLLECKERSTVFLKERLRLVVHPAKTTITSTEETNFFLGAAIRDYRRYAKNDTVGHFHETVRLYERAIETGAYLDLLGMYSVLNSYLGYFQHFKAKTIVERTLRESPVLNYFTLTPNCKKVILKPL